MFGPRSKLFDCNNTTSHTFGLCNTAAVSRKLSHFMGGWEKFSPAPLLPCSTAPPLSEPLREDAIANQFERPPHLTINIDRGALAAQTKLHLVARYALHPQIERCRPGRSGFPGQRHRGAARLRVDRHQLAISP